MVKEKFSKTKVCEINLRTKVCEINLEQKFVRNIYPDRKNLQTDFHKKLRKMFRNFRENC
jgi:hypothetical protein